MKKNSGFGCSFCWFNNNYLIRDSRSSHRHLVTCMADNTTGKDRKEIARWIFVIMSIHPEIQGLSKVTEKDRNQIDRAMAEMVTRLLTGDCRVQVKLAVETEGEEEPLKAAFGAIGKLAMQEITTNSRVDSAAASYAKYLDMHKLKAVFLSK